MSKDIQSIIDGWEFRPNEISVRKIMGRDGKWKVQLRLDLGLLQMELYGRPDGMRPFGYESLLEYYKARLRDHRQETGTDEDFHLDAEDCSALQRESIQYYHRYLSLFQLKDYAHVQNDTKRNLEVIDLVKNYAIDEKDVWGFEQYRPYVQMMNTRAKASIWLVKKAHQQAIIEIEDGIQKIRKFFQGYGQSHITEQSLEIKFLNNWRKEIQEKRPLSLEEKLEKKLGEAVDNEEYEQAALLRDQLNTLRKK
jgi:hypothetical protein